MVALEENLFSRYKDIEVTESFTYLDSAVHAYGMSNQEVIGVAAEATKPVKKSIRRCMYLCRTTKLHVFKVLILTVLLYGSETLTVTSALESGLNAFCNKSLRQIMGYNWQDHVSNRRPHRETGMGPVTCFIRDHQPGIYGHLACFPMDDPAHQVVSFRHNPAWRRPMGRLGKSWLEQLDQICSEKILEMGQGPAWRHWRP
ncbi:uncharacterized protein [Penaeus vannamei]|uniref:uncharacterized protein n=1 Tax=Penaeus vannamei TaxID=6689 RepID=UPI00387F564D